MSDATTAVAEPTIAVESAAPAIAPATTTDIAAPDPSKDPLWVKDRLEQMKRSILKEVGFESLEDAKKAGEERAAAKEAKKTEAQKRAEAETALATAQAEAEKSAKALGIYAADQMKALSEVQQAAVKGIAGDDPAAQLNAISALRPTWAGAAAPAAPSTQDSAPARTAPKDGGNVAPPEPKAIYAAMKETNPIIAARYALTNGLLESK